MSRCTRCLTVLASGTRLTQIVCCGVGPPPRRGRGHERPPARPARGGRPPGAGERAPGAGGRLEERGQVVGWLPPPFGVYGPPIGAATRSPAWLPVLSPNE